MNKNIGLRNWLAAGLLVLLLVVPVSTAVTIKQEKVEPNHNEKNTMDLHPGYFYIHGWYQSIEKVNDWVYIHCKAGKIKIMGLESLSRQELWFRFYYNDKSTYIETEDNFIFYGLHHIIGFIGGYYSY